MGGSSSTLSNAEGYIKSAEDGKKLADDIMHLFFSNANLYKLLDLHKISECPKFIFATSKYLAKQFQVLKIDPKQGKDGEIAFAAVSDFSPELLPSNTKNDAAIQEKIHDRNKLCIDIGYFYVRVFQIYTALALTTINADPVRMKRGLSMRFKTQKQFQSAPLLGGARIYQKGGSISKTEYQKLNIDKTPLKTIDELIFLKNMGVSSTTLTIKPSASASIYLLILYTTPTNTLDSVTYDGELYHPKLEGGKINISFSMEIRDTIATIRVSGYNIDIEQSLQKAGISWSYIDENNNLKSDPSVFFKKLDIFNTGGSDYSGSSGYSGTGYSGSSGFQGRSGIGMNPTAGKTSYEGFEELKKIFKDTAKEGKDFPKAYCIARAMTLLSPIFDSEFASKNNEPYKTQICRNKYDFEEINPFMPRAGTSARANVYLRSFVSLYYDDYTYKTASQKIELMQTEPSRTSLREASEKFAKLYNLVGEQKGFLTGEDEGRSAVKFTEFDFCKDKMNKILNIKKDKEGNELVKNILNNCIFKMLDFQKNHTIEVNKLLKEMFRFETQVINGKPRQLLRLQPAIKEAGRDGINRMGVKAHDLLLKYYITSEAFYIRGVYMMSEKKGAFY